MTHHMQQTPFWTKKDYIFNRSKLPTYQIWVQERALIGWEYFNLSFLTLTLSQFSNDTKFRQQTPEINILIWRSWEMNIRKFSDINNEVDVGDIFDFFWL